MLMPKMLCSLIIIARKQSIYPYTWKGHSVSVINVFQQANGNKNWNFIYISFAILPKDSNLALFSVMNSILIPKFSERKLYNLGYHKMSAVFGKCYLKFLNITDDYTFTQIMPISCFHDL